MSWKLYTRIYFNVDPFPLSVNVSADIDVGRGSLKQTQSSYIQPLLLWRLSDRVSGRMDIPGDKSHRHAHNHYVIGRVKETLSETHRALSPQTHMIICTSFISSMVCTVLLS